MSAITLRPSRELLKRTTTRCPVCRLALPGEVWREGIRPARVILRRTCPTHGPAEAVLATDARFYWLAQGDPKNANSNGPDLGCCGGACHSADGTATGTLGRNAGHLTDPRAAMSQKCESLSTCLALIEIVNSCNLACPTCYADSPVGLGGRVDAVPLADLQRRIDGVIARKGKIEILQLSGGEPTLHPHFFELLAWAQAHERIDFVLVNTNGVRLAHESEFTQQFALAAARKGVQLYLQFDGVQAAAQRELRGADLRAVREKALSVCARIGLPVTLAMTVTPQNLPHVGDAIRFGLAHPHIHGLTFQPLFTSGRVSPPSAAPTAGTIPGKVRLNTADILIAAVEQSAGQLTYDDFTPLPCGDPNCATIGYLLRIGGKVHSVSEFVDFAKLQGFLRDKVNYRLEDLARCGCETEPLGQVLHGLELQPGIAFRMMVKPFMDAWTWDQDRIDRCCTHVIRPDGKLDSFCRYYSGFGEAA